MKYDNYQRNHVILPGREKALDSFLKKDYKGLSHKWKNAVSSNSEDALTWSCFDVIAQMPFSKKIIALDEILEDSFDGDLCNFRFEEQNYKEDEVEIAIGKDYSGENIGEDTEVDAIIETRDKVIFFEAKLYSSISLADESNNKPHNQIARKLRVGLDYAYNVKKEFYFIFLDIAPPDKLLTFSKTVKSKENALDKSKGKWKSAWWYNYYKNGRNKSLKPLKEALEGVKYNSLESVANNMGWLTWADLFKIVMRGMI
jgi:hypothetical protein